MLRRLESVLNQADEDGVLKNVTKGAVAARYRGLQQSGKCATVADLWHKMARETRHVAAFNTTSRRARSHGTHFMWDGHAYS